jgi:hypothetical protein
MSWWQSMPIWGQAIVIFAVGALIYLVGRQQEPLIIRMRAPRTRPNNTPDEDATFGIHESNNSVTGFVLVGVALMAGLGYLLNSKNFANQQVEIQTSIVIILGVIALMLLLFVMAGGFKRLGLDARDQPLGLPEGSIRAMISLILILIFVMFGMFLYRSINSGSFSGPIPGLTADQVQKMTNVGIVEEDKKNRDLYQVWITTNTNQDAKSLAQQLITTIGTLVVAVSGFYFGSQTSRDRGNDSGSLQEKTQRTASNQETNQRVPETHGGVEERGQEKKEG